MSLPASPKENLLMALWHEEPYWLPCPTFDGSLIVVSHGLVEHRLRGRDAWGVEWALRDERSGSFPVTHPLKDPEMIDEYPFPSPEEADLTPAIEVVKEVNREEVLVAGDNGWGLFERAWLLVGMERLFVWSYRYPDAVKRLIERIAEVKVRLTERLAEEAEIDMVLYGDDWGMNDRLLFPPEWWREFIMPWQAKLYRAAKQYGVLVYQHSDGRVEDLIPYLVEMGVDALNIQPECNDWRSIKERYGAKVTLWGGVSARTLDLGSPIDVEREVAWVAELGRDGGVVLAPGHSMMYPPENIEAMRRAWIRYGWYHCPQRR
ncbi:MAG: hypothetical protein DRK00_05475 [Thermoprotei archaeon]|nr:MAG: hypothetical protein DRK00_05475 [Thermoprotei archaeon]